MGVPGADDVMLSLPEHLFPRRALCPQGCSGLRPAPEFEAWLARMGLAEATPERFPEKLAPALAGLA